MTVYIVEKEKPASIITGYMPPVETADEDFSGVTVLSLRSGAELGGHRFIATDASGNAFHADHTNFNLSDVVGITTHSAVPGAMVQVLTHGPIEMGSWAWTCKRLFLGVDGGMLATPPQTGFVLTVAVPVSPTRILVKIGHPIQILGGN